MLGEIGIYLKLEISIHELYRNRARRGAETVGIRDGKEGSA